MPQARAQELPGKKRSSGPADVHEHESTAGREAPVMPKKKRGYRKASHAIRKEEIKRLQVEITQLQNQINNLQHEALAPKGQNDELSSNVLQNLVKKQQTTFVNIQAAMSSYSASSIQCGSPIQRTIVLPNEELPRREILRSMKTLKLEDARRFMRQRLAHLTPTNSLSEERRFENDAGDYWAVRFTTTPFESARSVKQVFDLVIYFLSNSEISISEKVGHLTVREDGDNREQGIVQNRLVSMTGKGLHMETNSIIFHEYWEAGTRHEDDYGLIVSEFADADERHPYRPDTRIRKDASIVMEVRAYPSKQQEKVVVLTLWSHSHLRRPSFPVPKDAWHELRENMDRWSQNMHKNILETLEPSLASSREKPKLEDILISFQFTKDAPPQKTRNQVSTMNTKICLAAFIAVVATTVNAKLCQPGCGGQHSGQNAYISSCCQQYEADVGANFDACCASSCANGSPCKWEDLGSTGGEA